MKQSFYVYNNGDLKRKDNTLQFTTYEGEKRDIPIERISDIYVKCLLIQHLSITFLSMGYQFISLITIIFILEVIIREKACWQDSYW